MRTISRIICISLLLCGSALADPAVSDEDLAKVSPDSLLVLVPRTKTIDSLNREIADLQNTQESVVVIAEQGDPNESAQFLIELLQAERAVELARQERAKAVLVRSVGARVKLSNFEKAIITATKNLETVRSDQAEERLHF